MYPATRVSTATTRTRASRPDPVEPDAKQAARSETALQTASNDELRRVLHHNHVSAPSQHRTASADSLAKRRKVDTAKSLSLPQLPTRGNDNKRQRLPPTLSGLHQPPPDAGLLPSISVKQRDESFAQQSASTEANGAIVGQGQPSGQRQSRPMKPNGGRRKWTDSETAQLLQGVARFGIGKWTKILRCDDYDFGTRSALDLKDRFRVCCPEQYKNDQPGTLLSAGSQKHIHEPSRDGRKSTIDLHRLGITSDFRRSDRRKRHIYTEQEDKQLLVGYRRYGKSWATIQQDLSLGLGHRTRTDLRDRMRTRYPEIYARAGEITADDLVKHGSVSQSSPDRPSKAQSTAMMRTPTQTRTGNAQLLQHGAFDWNSGDLYLPVSFEDAELDSQTITLDRGILEWATVRPMAPNQNPTEQTPKTARSAQHRTQPRLTAAAASLPSLAAITAPDGHIYDHDKSLNELPALFFTHPSDNDYRPGPHAFLSLDELLT